MKRNQPASSARRILNPLRQKHFSRPISTAIKLVGSDSIARIFRRRSGAGVAFLPRRTAASDEFMEDLTEEEEQSRFHYNSFIMYLCKSAYASVVDAGDVLF